MTSEIFFSSMGEKGEDMNEEFKAFIAQQKEMNAMLIEMLRRQATVYPGWCFFAFVCLLCACLCLGLVFFLFVFCFRSIGIYIGIGISIGSWHWHWH